MEKLVLGSERNDRGLQARQTPSVCLYPLHGVQRQYVLSIDIGAKTLSMYLEELDVNKVSQIENVPWNRRYNIDGTATEEFASLLNSLILCGKRVWIEKKDITAVDDKRILIRKKKGRGKKGVEIIKGKGRLVITNRLLNRLTEYLDEVNKKGIFDLADIVVIEAQLFPLAEQIQYHIRSYLLITYENFDIVDSIFSKQLFCFHSKFKTQILGAPKRIEKDGRMVKLDKTGRKKWSKEKGMEIYTLRKDEYALDYIFKKNRGKADDLTDATIQCLAFVYMYYVDKIDFN